MGEELISLDTAKIAKEKGFPQYGNELFDMYHPLNTPLMYYSDNHIWGYYYNMEPENRVAIIPPQSLLQKWLRDVHNLDVSVERGWVNKMPIYECVVWKLSQEYWVLLSEEDTLGITYEFKYEVALEKGLQFALKKIKV